MTGPTGTKKTGSVCLLARDWMIEAAKCRRTDPKAWRFVSFPTLKLQLQEAWKDGSLYRPSEIISDLATVPLLIIDE